MTQVEFGPVNITQGNSAEFVVEYFDSNQVITTPTGGTVYVSYTNSSNAATTDTVTLAAVGNFFTGTWSTALAALGLANWIVVSAGSTTSLQQGVIRVITP